MQTNHHVGRLSREPKFYIRGEKEMQIAYFSLAINDLKDNKATFLDYVAFGKTAELVRDKLNTKGQIVEVSFNMQNHNFVDNRTGQKRYEIQNVVTTFRTYKSNRGDSKTSQAETPMTTQSDFPDINNMPSYPNFDSSEIDYFGG
ncbi:single-stranded DNA-binding protein [Leuconostoc citreum]|uniref:single-stranded DNA-binding protein n=1 Tax=Leuconostoc citreum TaxID=33964 RepID=UPI00200AE850|nr:single-stranded DNA-binding protein [Leuconostoc citreum]MCK8605768.1 single-stranded DNA-binding protein [Leuconostoc citreum]